jgi:hypothetical protein
MTFLAFKSLGEKKAFIKRLQLKCHQEYTCCISFLQEESIIGSVQVLPLDLLRMHHLGFLQTPASINYWNPTITKHFELYSQSKSSIVPRLS